MVFASLALSCPDGREGRRQKAPFPRISPGALGHHCKGKFLGSLNEEGKSLSWVFTSIALKLQVFYGTTHKV